MVKNPILVNFAVEDDLSEAVLKTILKQTQKNYYVAATYRRGGFGYLKTKVAAFNAASESIPFFLLTDLDTVGPGYNAFLIEFVLKSWKADKGVSHSNSLSRTFWAVKCFKPITS